MGAASEALSYIFICRLTFHMFFDSKSVPTRRALLYPCHTGLGELSHHKSTLRNGGGERKIHICIHVDGLLQKLLTLLNLQLAGLTGTTVADLFTRVFSAVEQGTALLVTLQQGSQATAHRLTAAIRLYHP